MNPNIRQTLVKIKYVEDSEKFPGDFKEITVTVESMGYQEVS